MKLNLDLKQKVASKGEFEKLGYNIEIEEEENRYYITEGDYKFEIVEDENGRQEVVCIGEATVEINPSGRCEARGCTHN